MQVAAGACFAPLPATLHYQRLPPPLRSPCPLQVLTVFFGSFVAGSFANQIRQFAQQPGSILTVLGTAAPQTALL